MTNHFFSPRSNPHSRSSPARRIIFAFPAGARRDPKSPPSGQWPIKADHRLPVRNGSPAQTVCRSKPASVIPVNPKPAGTAGSHSAVSPADRCPAAAGGANKASDNPSAAGAGSPHWRRDGGPDLERRDGPRRSCGRSRAQGGHARDQVHANRSINRHRVRHRPRPPPAPPGCCPRSPRTPHPASAHPPNASRRQGGRSPPAE